MDVCLLYFDDCANWVEADANLAEALRATGHVDVVVEYVKVESAEAAVATRFRGSPTIVVNGVDLFDDPEIGFGLTCRRYVTPTGLAGAPTTDHIAERLLRVADGTR